MRLLRHGIGDSEMGGATPVPGNWNN